MWHENTKVPQNLISIHIYMRHMKPKNETRLIHRKGKNYVAQKYKNLSKPNFDIYLHAA